MSIICIQSINEKKNHIRYEVDTVKDILVRNMEEAAKLHVKLEVEVKEGSNWDEAH